MRSRSAILRKSVIPDIQVKILDLFLNDDENGILMPITKRESKNIEFRADWVLRDVITSRIKQKQECLPFVIRKRQLYEEAIKKDNEEKLKHDLARLCEFKNVPITMRKYLLYQQAKAG